MQDFRTFRWQYCRRKVTSPPPTKFTSFSKRRAEVEIWSILMLCTWKSSKCSAGLISPTLIWSLLNFRIAECWCEKHVAGHWLGPTGTTLSVRKETFYFTSCFCTILEEGLSNPPTFSHFTHFSPVVTAIEFVTKTRYLEVSFDILIFSLMNLWV